MKQVFKFRNSRDFTVKKYRSLLTISKKYVKILQKPGGYLNE
jgi:hypothetical protein